MDSMHELNLEEMEKVTGGAGLKNGMVEADGTVVGIGNNATFTVDVNGQMIHAHMSGKLRMNFIRIRTGDRVRVEYSPSELRGRITWRSK